MQSFTYTVNDENGIHARPAGVIVNSAKKFTSSITVKCNGKSADCKKLFSIMGLGAVKGDILNVTVEGQDEKSAASTVRNAMEEAGL